MRNPADGAAETLFGIAASLTDGQSADVSILYLRMALYLRPDLGLAQVLLADRFETLRKFDVAIEIYRSIQPSSPYYRMAQVQAALDLQRMGKREEAIASLKKLVVSAPNDSESWVALGDTYRASNMFAEAVDAYNRAEKAIARPSKRDWTMFYARAMAKEKIKRLDESEADIQTALKLSPDQPELLNYLGYSWVDRGRNIPQALTMLEKARTLRPYDGYIVDSVGWAYYQLGRYDDAATHPGGRRAAGAGRSHHQRSSGRRVVARRAAHRCPLPVEPCAHFQRCRHRQGGDRAQTEDRLERKARLNVICEQAPAKINLFLHVGERRADGFHPLQSLAVFTDMGDALQIEPAPDLSLNIQGPFAKGLEGEGDNLVLRARACFGRRARRETDSHQEPAGGLWHRRRFRRCGGGAARLARLVEFGQGRSRVARYRG